MYDNYLINLDIDSLEMPIYRIIPLDYFLESLLNKEIVLVKPHLWEDPFEEFLSKQKFLGPEGKSYTLENFGNQFFSQCWSLNKESDFMWRVYSQNNRSVKIKTDIKTLINEIVENSNNEVFLKIGKVDYWSDEKIKDKFRDPNYTSSLFANGYYNSLLIKKESFKHENEIRLIYSDNTNGEELLKKNVEPNKLFHEIEFHPKFPKNPSRKDIEKTIRKIGFNNKITFSEMYEVPNLEIKFNYKS